MENTVGMNIIPDNDKERILAVKRYQILDTPPEHAFDNVARLATQIFKVPVSLISLVDADKVFFKANIGMGNARVVSRSDSICSLAILDKEITLFGNAAEEPCLMANPNVSGSFGLKFYAGAPLITSDGYMIGTLCIIDKEPRQFTEHEKTILQGLAEIVMDEIELRLASILETTKQQVANKQLLALNKEVTSTNEELKVTIDQLAVSQNSLSQAYIQLSETNERLELALAAGKLGSYELDFHTGQLACTEQFKQNFGLNPSATFNQGELMEAILPEFRDMVQKKIADAVHYNTVYLAEYKISWPDGSRHWIAASGKISEDQTNGVKRMVGITLDITERKEFEQQKDDFLGIASHELKTPITSLKANLQMLDRLKDTSDNPLVAKLVDASNKSMERLTVMVNDLLNIHQFREGHLALNKRWFTVAKMLEVCCNHVRFEGKYQLIITGDKQLQVYADEHRIDQVVVNFVNNAVKYAPKSKDIILEISKKGDFVKIGVTDKGPGIPVEHHKRLFERYWRADHSGSQYSGLGIGLHICSEIIKNHKGEIGVDSEVGGGSTFWFTIPLIEKIQ